MRVSRTSIAALSAIAAVAAVVLGVPALATSCRGTLFTHLAWTAATMQLVLLRRDAVCPVRLRRRRAAVALCAGGLLVLGLRLPHDESTKGQIAEALEREPPPPVCRALSLPATAVTVPTPARVRLRLLFLFFCIPCKELRREHALLAGGSSLLVAGDLRKRRLRAP